VNRDKAIEDAVDALSELAASVDVAATLEAMAIYLAGQSAASEETANQLHEQGYAPAASQEIRLSGAFEVLYEHVTETIGIVIPILDKPIPKLRVVKNPPKRRRR
jgi:hypothetical protein